MEGNRRLAAVKLIRQNLSQYPERKELAYVRDFIEDAKTSGVVRSALDGAGFSNLAVAPPEPRR